MIEVHHLNESRSRRITWLLEELGLDYTVHVYKRDPKTRLAPPELEKIHPLGKAPVIRDGDEVVFESGAIIEYLIRKHGNGRLAPRRTRMHSTSTCNSCTTRKAPPCCRSCSSFTRAGLVKAQRRCSRASRVK